jgi:hypothetical protein
MVMKQGPHCLVIVALVGAGCATTPRVSAVPESALVDERGESVDVRQVAHAAPLTVMVFFSKDCHCLSQHEPRLRALHDEYSPRGVQFLMIDSEVSASVARDQEEARKRGYPFAIFVDPHARLADLVGAEYATYSVIVDESGRIRYRGGIDADKTHLHADATPYLKNALDDLLASREPRTPEAKTLGCALRKW